MAPGDPHRHPVETLILARYSHQDEFEADALAIGYLHEAGLDPAAVIRMLEANEAHAVLVGTDTERHRGMLSSHPSTPERMSRAMILSRRLGAGPDRTAGDGFLDRIDGLHFGSRPQMGLVRGQEVFLGGTEIRFRMPDGFHIRREPGRVTARAMDGTLIVYDEMVNQWGMGIVSYLPRGSRDIELLRIRRDACRDCGPQPGTRRSSLRISDAGHPVRGSTRVSLPLHRSAGRKPGPAG